MAPIEGYGETGELTVRVGDRVDVFEVEEITLNETPKYEFGYGFGPGGDAQKVRWSGVREIRIEARVIPKSTHKTAQGGQFVYLSSEDLELIARLASQAQPTNSKTLAALNQLRAKFPPRLTEKEKF